MTKGDRIKLLIQSLNPIAIRRRKRMRGELINHNITFLTPNCLGGLLFHDLNLQFCSPTVNLMMNQKDFAKFVLNMDYYLKKKLHFYKNPDYAFPCAHLGDIDINFTHYTSAIDAEERWNSRCQRINRENMFVFLEERDGLTKEEIESLAKLSVKGLVIFTAHSYSDIPYTLFLSKYADDGEVGNILTRNFWDDSREYEQYFDFVKWFNEADGGDYNIRSFVKL